MTGRSLGAGRRIAAALLLLATLATPLAAETSRLRFAAGTDSTTVRTTVAGYDGTTFLVGAKAGQTLVVEMRTNNGSANFNVTAPGADEALFIGSIGGTRFEGVLPVSGDYRIDTYLMRNAARRGETADIRLTVSIPATPAADFADSLTGGPDYWVVANLSAGDSLNLRSGPSVGDAVIARLSAGQTVRNLGCRAIGASRWCRVAVERQGLIGWANGRYLREGSASGSAGTGQPGLPVATNGRGFDATGTIPCARDRGQPMAACAFGVQRRGGGSADVFVAFPGGGQRLISFSQGEPRAADSGNALTVARDADLWLIRIGRERFEIPDAVVSGG